ncbi:hypothetical protein [Mesorhizobium sp. M4A.F.Ca.ET.020.02.1.1]|nr:hypothetical protein [Mesorhizobium sp. M4A.F.Ca.ET.020.02.1.1]
MTSKHKLWAIAFVCVALASIAMHVSKHDGCIAFCTNIANAGGG